MCACQVVHAHTLEEVKDALLEASSRLHALGIFKGVDILADKSETVRACARCCFVLEQSLVDTPCARVPPHREALTPAT